MIWMRKTLLFICCFSAMAVAGEEQDHSVLPRIEVEVASLSVCNKDQPCTICIEKTAYGYSARVLRAATISDMGVIKYLPSATHYQFNEHGGLIKQIATP